MNTFPVLTISRSFTPNFFVMGSISVHTRMMKVPITADVHRFPNLTILAPSCDGKIDCIFGTDEDNCDEHPTIIVYGLLIIASVLCGSLLLAYMVRVSYLQKSEKESLGLDLTQSEENMKFLIENLINLKWNETNINLSKFGGKFISGLFYHVRNMEYETRKKAAKVFMESIRKNESLLWMKQNIDEKVSLFLLTTSEGGLMDRFLPYWLHNKVTHRGSRMGLFIGILKSVVSLFSNQMDLFMDLALSSILMYFHTGALL